MKPDPDDRLGVVAEKPIDYEALATTYSHVIRGPHCSHEGAEIEQSGNIYYFHCPACGRNGAAAEITARTLGWIP